MIWAPDNKPAAHDSSIGSYVVAQIGDICGSELALTETDVAEIGRAVECFLEQDESCSYVDTQYLVLLASRALSSIGQGHAARRLLLMGTGAVRPSDWEVWGGEEMWVIDLKQITVRHNACLELLFFKSLSVVVDSMANVWDQANGHGVLGLRNVCCAANAVLGTPRKQAAISAMADEIKAMVARKLELIGADRNWSGVPQVTSLDI